MDLLTPKYITEEVVRRAVEAALSLTINQTGTLHNLVDCDCCHIVVLVPAMRDERALNYPSWPDLQTRAYAMFEHSVGDRHLWQYPLDDIAQCKAVQLWTSRNDGGAGVMPHLLFPGDTVYWGGVKREGIVVTCSGPEPWFDRLISGIVADTIIALARHSFENDPEVKAGVNFLS